MCWNLKISKKKVFFLIRFLLATFELRRIRSSDRSQNTKDDRDSTRMKLLCLIGRPTVMTTSHQWRLGRRLTSLSQSCGEQREIRDWQRDCQRGC